MAAVLILVPAMVVADITPSHVYQVTDDIVAELGLIYKATQSTNSSTRYSENARKPRHVLQKAREVLLKVQLFRKLNGLSKKSVPAIPTREIRPSDVKKMMDRILVDLREAGKKLNVTSKATPAALSSGKTPTDVYNNIALAGAMVDGLGVPSIVPNDVYRLTETLVSDIRLVVKKIGGNGLLESLKGSRRKKPKHVYQEVYGLLSDLKAMCAKESKYCVPGGVVLPKKRSGRIKPGHVLDIVNNALAEVGSLKTKLGVNVTSKLSPVASGKTPTDVYDSARTGRALISSYK